MINLEKMSKEHAELYEELDELVEAEIKRKWEVNKSRTWEWNGKTYKHVGKDGNE